MKDNASEPKPLLGMSPNTSGGLQMILFLVGMLTQLLHCFQPAFRVYLLHLQLLHRLFKFFVSCLQV